MKPPAYIDGESGEFDLLESAYISILQVCALKGVGTVGVSEIPLLGCPEDSDIAMDAAATTIFRDLQDLQTPREVHFYFATRRELATFEGIVSRLNALPM